jgi:hypothetical protein
MFVGGAVRDVREVRGVQKLYRRAHRIKKAHLGPQLYGYWVRQNYEEVVCDMLAQRDWLLSQIRHHARVLWRRR